MEEAAFDEGIKLMNDELDIIKIMTNLRKFNHYYKSMLVHPDQRRMMKLASKKFISKQYLSYIDNDNFQNEPLDTDKEYDNKEEID